MKNINLIATVHHPNVKKKDLESVLTQLSHLFSSVYLTVSTATSALLTQTFLNSSVNSKIIEPKGEADARRRVLQFALSQTEVDENNIFFYCDFDKVFVAYLKEKAALINYLEGIASLTGFEIVGRDDLNWQTYPKTWQETEAITNKVASALFKLKDLDITAGCCAFDNVAARLIAKESVELLTDTEWPIICQKAGLKITSSKVAFLPFDWQYNKGRNDDNWKGYIPRLRLALQAMASFENWQD